MSENTVTVESWSNLKIQGMNIKWFAICTIILGAASWFDKLPANMITGFAICMCLGALLNTIGEKIGFLRDYCGGGAILAMVGSAVLVYMGLLPDNIVNATKHFIDAKGVDFLNFYIAALITGSILGMDRKLLISAGLRYFIPLVAGVAAAYGVAGVLGSFLGYGWKEAILYIAAPIMGGGTGAGAVPMSQIYSSVLNRDAKEMFGMIYPAVVLGNVLAIIFSAFLHRLGLKYSRLSGNGSIMHGYTYNEEVSDSRQMTMLDLGGGLMFACTMYIMGLILGDLIPTIHPYALMIIALVIMKVCNIVPEEIQFIAQKWYTFVAQAMTYTLMVGCGIALLSIQELLGALGNVSFFAICLAVVATAAFAAGAVGMLVKFFFVESALTAGLCMANQGGNGDVACLSAAHRMNLMPFAQMSSRLGGALILVIQSVLIRML